MRESGSTRLALGLFALLLILTVSPFLQSPSFSEADNYSDYESGYDETVAGEEVNDGDHDEEEYDEEYYDDGPVPEQIDSSPFDDAVTMSEEEIVTVNVLRNDRSYIGWENSLKIVETTQAEHGQITVNSDNTITYSPSQIPLPSGYEKAETIRYTASADGISSYTGSLTIWVQQVNDPPIAYSANYTIDENQQTLFNLEVHDEDNDSLTYQVISSTTYGTSELDPYTGMLAYTPLCEFSGKEILTYQVSDGQSTSDVAWIEITVLEVGGENSCLSSDEYYDESADEY